MKPEHSHLEELSPAAAAVIADMDELLIEMDESLVVIGEQNRETRQDMERLDRQIAGTTPDIPPKSHPT